MQVVCLTVLLGRVQIRTNKRYAAASGQGFTMTEVAAAVERDFGKIDVLVHSLANGPEVTKPLLETSRKARICPLTLLHGCARSARLKSPRCCSIPPARLVTHCLTREHWVSCA